MKFLYLVNVRKCVDINIKYNAQLCACAYLFQQAVFCSFLIFISQEFNLHHLDLILHLQGQASR